MQQAEAVTGPSTEHVAGNFYKATDANGGEYVGPQDKAEAFARGEFNPTYRALPVIEKEEAEGDDEQSSTGSDE